jgi:hypothetical protein
LNDVNKSGNLGQDRLMKLGFVGMAILIYVALCLSIFGFVADDAYISFLYARNLVWLHELTPSSGTYVQGFTNLLWVLIVSLLYWIVGAEALEVAVKAFLMICGGATVCFLAATLSRLKVRTAWTGFSCASLATSTPFVVWTMGGLETVFLALIISLIVYVYLHHPDSLALLFGLILLSVLTRLDSILFAVPLIVSLLVFGKETDKAPQYHNRPRECARAGQLTRSGGGRHLLEKTDRGTSCLARIFFPGKRILMEGRGVVLLKLTVFLAVPLACVLIWQRVYYGSVFPTSFTAKAAHSVPQILTRAISSGIPYFVDFLLVDHYWLAFAAVVLFVLRSARPMAGTLETDSQSRLLSVAMGLVLYWCYLITQGNLHMSLCFRFLVPTIPILLLFLGLGLEQMSFAWQRRRLARVAAYIAAGFLLACNAGTFYQAYNQSMLFTSDPLGDYAGASNANVRGWIVLYENWRQAAKEFGERVQSPATVYVADMAGMFPFFLRVPAFDGKLIGHSSDRHYDYVIDRCRCTDDPPRDVIRSGKNALGLPALHAPQCCFCLYPFRLRKEFSRWNNCVPGGDVTRCILHSDIEEVRELLARCVDTADACHETKSMITVAANFGNSELVELLLAHGAQVNSLDGSGHAALSWAVWRGHREVAQVLLAHGADVDMTATPYKPLLLAVLRRDKAMENLLRNHGAQTYFSEPGLRSMLTGRTVASVGVSLILLLFLGFIPYSAATRHSPFPVAYPPSRAGGKTEPGG